MERESFSLSDMEPVIKKVLSEEGIFSFYPKGTSMEPTIHQGVDQVRLKKLPKKLKRYQIILYKRDNGAFVLHRIVKVCKDSYIMRGDNQFYSESGIRREQMIGVACSLKTPKREVSTESIRFQLKSAIWVETASVRRILRSVRSRIAKILKNK